MLVQFSSSCSGAPLRMGSKEGGVEPEETSSCLRGGPDGVLRPGGAPHHRSGALGGGGSLHPAGGQLGPADPGRVPLPPGDGRRDPDHFGSKGERERTRGVHAKVETMRKQYDFTKARKNPYARRLKRQVTIRLDEETLGYFRRLSEESGIGYQTLINPYLRECAAAGKGP